jgi:hypothetical protein
MHRPEYEEVSGRACRDCRALVRGWRLQGGPHPYLVRSVGAEDSDDQGPWFRCLICRSLIVHRPGQAPEWHSHKPRLRTGSNLHRGGATPGDSAQEAPQ